MPRALKEWEGPRRARLDGGYQHASRYARRRRVIQSFHHRETRTSSFMTTRWAVLVAFGIMCDGMIPPDSRGQEPRLVPSEPACAACEIRLDLVARLGELDDPGGVGRPGVAARDGRGWYYVRSAEAPAEVDVFDSGGEYLRTFGRPGAGPGEFGTVSHMYFGANDTLHVFDNQNGRISVFSPEGELVRDGGLEGEVLKLAHLAEGRFAISGRVLTRESLGYPLHLIDGSGRLIRSFGAENAVFRPDAFYSFQRYIAPSGEGSIWAAHHLQYVIELWDVEGELKDVLVRRADWFPPQFTQRRRTPDTPDYPAIHEIREDANGLVWVIVRVNQPNWSEALGDPVESPDGRYYPVEDFDGLMGTRMEVIDPQRAAVVASLQTDEYVHQFVDDRHVVSYREDDGGVPRWLVWRVSLESGVEEQRNTGTGR